MYQLLVFVKIANFFISKQRPMGIEILCIKKYIYNYVAIEILNFFFPLVFVSILAIIIFTTTSH